ncbi:MAG: hypothetical protein V1770_04295 [bacterium]
MRSIAEIPLLSMALTIYIIIMSLDLTNLPCRNLNILAYLEGSDPLPAQAGFGGGQTPRMIATMR